jgi:hypothetical protein
MSAILWVFLVMAMFQVRGQVPPQSSSGRASISGVVVRAGAAPGFQFMAKAVVELSPAGVFSTTDGKGRFNFRNVAPGYYMLIPRKDGFVPQQDTGRGLSEFGMAIKVGGEQVRSDVELVMIPAPAISGFVYHPNGEPLAAGVVQAYARRYTPFGPQVRAVKKVLTNDLGEYRLYWLNFGEYMVAAGYGERVRGSGLAGVRLTPNVSKADEGYATVFYGGTTNPGEARSIRLAPGIDAGTANIVLTDVPRVKVRGQLVASTAMPRDVQIAFVPAGSDLTGGGDYTVNAGTGGNFEITGVAPGAYVMFASGSRMSSDVVSITVGNEDIERLRIPLHPMTAIKGLIGPNLTSPSQMRVQFIRRSIEVDQKFETIPDQHGGFTIDVGVGHYDVFIEGLLSNEHIEEMRYAARDVLPTGVLIAGDPSGDLEIEISASSASVEGRILNTPGRPGGGARIVLVPERKLRHRPDRYFIGLADGTGAFQLNDVPTGEYTGYAFELIEPGAHFAFGYSATVNSRFAPYGAQVIVGGKGTKTVDLRVVPAAESAGGFQ